MHFLQLIRPINLAIIVATMYGIRLYLQFPFPSNSNFEFLFGILVFSTVLIAAAGNIINDYFDVRTDRVNRPNRVIIGKHIKPRWAIVCHWVLNVIAFGIAIYLAWIEHDLLYILIHLVAINLLWWYSVQLKKKPFIGNILVSGLTILVMYLVVVFLKDYTYNSDTEAHLYSLWDKSFELPKLTIVYIFMIMAFVQNLCREIIKDAEDVTGDQEINARTIPMIFGVRNTQILVAILSILLTCLYFGGILFYYPQFDWITTAPIAIAMLISFVLGVIGLSSAPNAIVWMKNLLKVSMLSGIIYLFVS